MSISGFFKKIFSPIINFFRGIDKKKAEQVINQIGSLVEIALPVVEIVAKLTPTPTDDLIIASLKSLGLTASQVVNASSDIYHDGARLAIATEALRLRLVELVVAKGKVQIDDFVLRTASDMLKLDSSVLRSAVQNAYSLYKLAR